MRANRKSLEPRETSLNARPPAPLAPVVGVRPLLALAALATGCAYQPGSFAHPGNGGEWPGERASVGCLDVATFARPPEADRIGQVVVVRFANRCDHTITVDFAALRAMGRDAEGRELALAIHDPERVLRPLPLEARLVGAEVFELRSAEDPSVTIRSACLDVGAVVADVERWVCVASPAPAAAVAEVTP